MRTNKRRLHSLETAIRPPTVQELSTDERAVLLMLAFQRVLMPALLETAEEWHANGRPPASVADKARTAAWSGRIERVFDAAIEANPRVNELIAQGRAQAIVERLTDWGLWKEPDPPPPDTETINERFERVFPHEAT